MSDQIVTTEERYRLLVEGAKDYAMLLVDTSGCVAGWNSGAERIMGWTEAEMIGQSMARIFTPGDIAAGVPDEELRRAARDGRAPGLRWHVKKDGTRFFADGILEALRDSDGELRGYANILRDATDGEIARVAIRESEARFRDAQSRLDAALSAGGIATWTWDVAANKVVADRNLARLFSVSEADAAAGNLEIYTQAIHPADRERVAAEIADAIEFQEQYSTEYRVVSPNGAPLWLEARGKVVRDAAGKAISLDGVLVDVTDRVKRGLRDQFFTKLSERISKLIDPVAIFAESARSVGEFLRIDRCTYVDMDFSDDTCNVLFDFRADPQLIDLTGVLKISAFGEYFIREMQGSRSVVVNDVLTDARQVPPETIPAYQAIGTAAFVAVPMVYSNRLVSNMAVHSRAPREWEAGEVELLALVVERTWYIAELARQNIALAMESEERRAAHERTANILESIGHPFYTLDFEWRFTYINSHAEAMWGRSGRDMLGTTFLEQFPQAENTEFELQLRRAMEAREVATFEEYYPPFESWFDVRAYPSNDGISIYFQNSTARKSAEEERERLLRERQARAERESLINRIGLALRSSSDPEQVLETSVRELGLALKADRCYYVSYNQDMDRAMLGPDWYAEGLQSLAGPYLMSPFVVNHQPDYRAGRTQVISDTQALNDVAALRIGLRSLVRVPLVSGAVMTALAVAMATEPREWTPDEVTLIETVATQTQTALEAALLSRREHAIAQQLQTALQPELPTHVPGLSIGAFSRAALDESEVGGDFMDLFPLDKEVYAIVVGDVSGKGLAAAQQLALIRNSLRTTLYLSRSAAQAVSSLNDIVTAHDLLVGFVTAFVAIYDAVSGEVAYASCGHEPALVRRASGGVEALIQANAPPLGVDQNAVYHESSLTLKPGDTLLVYTDGISEAGPNRRELLGTSGLSEILQTIRCEPGMQECAEKLVEEAQSFAGGAFRDDVAVLLARRE